ncbi:aldo/keto reductase family protein [Anatilimnocola floriformis]|uniref:aldo/keto reductase family protein n=1 Tax=Anatilimnocola floriformis TaxID=2948575 RepID=UPI0020C55E1D|nr:aldo/keto reductase [Anatilimnocola floriformis]
MKYNRILNHPQIASLLARSVAASSSKSEPSSNARVAIASAKRVAKVGGDSGVQPMVNIDELSFLYGTAWKEDATQQLTLMALQQGFRGIDTANQRKHYHEAAVGQAITAAIEQGLVTRDELFLQTKYTFIGGQDQRLPYDPHAPIAKQVEQSLASSLKHLHTTRIDSYVLHGPSQRVGLGADDWAAWRTMEAAQSRGEIRFLGISNVALDQLQLLVSQAESPVTFVQNRCYAARGWDREVRQFCVANNIKYQGFSLLTANRHVLGHPEIVALSRKHGCSPSQVIFRFAIDVGMLPLTGTADQSHMQADLSVHQFCLTAAEVAAVEQLG